MGKKVVSKVMEPITKHSNESEIILKKTKPTKEETRNVEKKCVLENVHDIYVSNIPLEWTRDDMIEYLAFENRAQLVAVRSLRYRICGVQQLSKIAIITFKDHIDVEKFNETINEQKVNSSKPFHSVKCEFSKVYESKQATINSKKSETKKLKKNKSQKNGKTRENKEVINSKSKKKKITNSKDSGSETEGTINESTDPNNSTTANTIDSLDEKGSGKHKNRHKHKKSDNTIYISNIPYDISRKQLAEFLKVKEEAVSLPMRKLQDLRTGKIFTSKTTNRGYSFINFKNCDPKDPIEQKVEQLQGQILDNRRLIIDIAIVKEKYSDCTKPTTIISVTRS